MTLSLARANGSPYVIEGQATTLLELAPFVNKVLRRSRRWMLFMEVLENKRIGEADSP